MLVCSVRSSVATRSEGGIDIGVGCGVSLDTREGLESSLGLWRGVGRRSPSVETPVSGLLFCEGGMRLFMALHFPLY